MAEPPTEPPPKQEKQRPTIDELIADLQNHPQFFTGDLSEGAELPPLVEAIRQIKYDEDQPPDEIAKQYKVDGNVRFKQGDFLAAIECYTKALEFQPPDPTLRSALLVNRSLAHFRRSNFGSSTRDARQALDALPDNAKAYFRGAQALLKLARLEQSLTWCEKAMQLDDEDAAIANLYRQIREAMAEQKRNERKAAKEQEHVDQLLAAIRSRGIVLRPANPWSCDSVALSPNNFSVHLEGESLVWPLRILIPELAVQEFVDQVNESSTIESLLQMILVDEPLPSDPERRYSTLDNVVVCLRGGVRQEELHLVPASLKLGEAIRTRACAVENAMPCLAIVHREFLESYSRTFDSVHSH